MNSINNLKYYSDREITNVYRLLTSFIHSISFEFHKTIKITNPEESKRSNVTCQIICMSVRGIILK